MIPEKYLIKTRQNCKCLYLGMSWHLSVVRAHQTKRHRQMTKPLLRALQPMQANLQVRFFAQATKSHL